MPGFKSRDKEYTKKRVPQPQKKTAALRATVLLKELASELLHDHGVDSAINAHKERAPVGNRDALRGAGDLTGLHDLALHIEHGVVGTDLGTKHLNLGTRSDNLGARGDRAEEEVIRIRIICTRARIGAALGLRNRNTGMTLPEPSRNSTALMESSPIPPLASLTSHLRPLNVLRMSSPNGALFWSTQSRRPPGYLALGSSKPLNPQFIGVKSYVVAL